MDETDKTLLAALRHNARASLSDLSLELGVSRTTVRSRIEKLQSGGIILGFTVVLREDMATSPVRGLMFLRIEGRFTDQVVRRLNGLPAVEAVHSTNGSWDLIVMLGASTLEELDLVLADIRRFEHVANSETSLMLATQRSRR